ncbi:hypothetical protein QQX09_00685 [Demequina sp. SYSU T00192]|uniref:Uncharacterized protein n=1 Tax=Demequina litoralis TaxID=3051660 RepID=A0ABT8G5F7_9MICO|nr:hypothetical protein [Demequina sp. SYSU T00192]MDN4474363.1 hypothetical protein [Demequina sp. SYSU T00192]
MTTTPDGTGIRSGSGIGVVVALAVVLAACAIPGAGAAPALEEGVVAAPVAAVGTALDRAFDANIAEVERFIDLGGRVSDGPDGLLLLDASGELARTGLVALAAHLADSLDLDAGIVREAVAAAATAQPDAASGLATGTAERDGYVLICTASHGGITLAFDDHRA